MSFSDHAREEQAKSVLSDVSSHAITLSTERPKFIVLSLRLSRFYSFDGSP